jgi:inner membrane protein
MASAISHPAVLLALAPAFGPAALDRRVLLFGALCSVLPDIDAIPHWLGVPSSSPFGHRGLTHSIVFAALLAAGLTAAAFRGSPSWRAVFLFLFLCGASHGFLDMMTTGGQPIAWLWPFGERRFLPWRPIQVSPVSVSRFLGRRGLEILRNELVWIWIPCLALGALLRFVKGSGARA